IKMYEEIIFMDQLLHHRSVASQIQETRATWQKRSSWYPAAQREYYSAYSSIYDDCLKKYGDDHFEYYAKRNRLRSELRTNTRATLQQQAKDEDISMDHLNGYKAPKTTNGEYGSVRPSELFNCF
ncbi:hypothetical protein KR009_008644, partial [Drosophila setifemur]